MLKCKQLPCALYIICIVLLHWSNDNGIIMEKKHMTHKKHNIVVLFVMEEVCETVLLQEKYVKPYYYKRPTVSTYEHCQ